MIKNILFDFDGVILNSMKIKGEGFAELFKTYPQNDIKSLEEYHYANGGVSRFEKIRYFFNAVLRSKITDEEVAILANQFADIIMKKLFDKKNLIEETILFIKNNDTTYNLHIVSGAEHNELNDLCSFFDIAHSFKSIEGSPTTKSRLISNLLEKNRYRTEETILIGDSINDYDAAAANGILFYGYNNESLKVVGNYIESFSDFQP